MIINFKYDKDILQRRGAESIVTIPMIGDCVVIDKREYTVSGRKFWSDKNEVDIKLGYVCSVIEE